MRRRLVFQRGDEGEAPPRLSTRGQGHYLVFPRGDETASCSLAGRQGVALSSSSGTRRRLVFPRWDEAAPRSPAGIASSSSSGTKGTRTDPGERLRPGRSRSDPHKRRDRRDGEEEEGERKRRSVDGFASAPPTSPRASRSSSRMENGS
ncbi:hypothetical protein GW17_00027430 [Ensete ventricosum]|nr:hypothetical protein GW17_00027430 [Ensete ventricosum]